MNSYAEIFKIETNNMVPKQGRVLIAEPFLCDNTFSRTVVLLVEHTQDGSMGLIMNKSLPLRLNDVFSDFEALERIPIYRGGPLGTDTLFYLHTIGDIPGAFPIDKGFYLNGDFDAVKAYVLQGNPIKGTIRFFLGYSGWDNEQLERELKQNSWLVGKEKIHTLMDVETTKSLWKNALVRLGGKYEVWSRFPKIPTLN
ncbi:MAG: YqgE/AlgH family protein [Prevotellaceae bacterium]|nr:YqgE/AlgH family protein [Prevotellaceae bacterium]